jgi:hypothetical protein
VLLVFRGVWVSPWRNGVGIPDLTLPVLDANFAAAPVLHDFLRTNFGLPLRIGKSTGALGMGLDDSPLISALDDKSIVLGHLFILVSAISVRWELRQVF